MSQSLEDAAGAPAAGREHDLRVWLVSRVADWTETDASQINTSASFPALGLDSVAVFSLTCELEEHLDRQIPSTLFSDCDTIEELVQYLSSNADTLSAR